MDRGSLVFCVIGGDSRQRQCISLLASRGYFVKALGFKDINYDNVEVYQEVIPALLDCDVLLLPIPYKDKNGYINVKEIDFNIRLKELLDKVIPSTFIILGKVDEEFKRIADAKGLLWCDIVQYEPFSILNAIPTAEGAIQKAMEMTDITLHGARTLVLGFGRIGKCLARMLKGIGAMVTVEARNHRDLAWISENGYNPIHLNELDSVISTQDVIFNTIPHIILDRRRLELVSRDTVIIDLASFPGGTDFETADALGIRACLELGLPGSVAPKTAAEAICNATLDIVKELHEQ